MKMYVYVLFHRFSPENKLGRNPFHFLPFGYGPRNCIGMRLALQNLKIAIAKLLQKVTLKPCERTQVIFISISNDIN